jgi:L-asparaginase / beta-aspartyl-peptidase
MTTNKFPPSCLSILSLFCLLTSIFANLGHSNPKEDSFVIAVHAGAGSYNRTLINLEKEAMIKKGIFDALKAGFDTLRKDGNHMAAVKEAIIQLEDNPQFNAGKGGKLNQKFEVELDASIMDGSNLNCGAVGAVKHIKNPIKAAELVMNKTPHILLVSDDADEFAKEQGLDYVPNYYFFTLDRIKEWFDANKTKQEIKNRKGTVGAVARDRSGHLAAATSTGGITYKMAGRVGDTPIIGAGNYANDESCAVSCTGTGEIMMRRLMAFDIHARMIYKGLSLKESTSEVLNSTEKDTGGFIAVDKHGNVEMPYNSGGMARGYVREDGKAFIYIFNDGEDLTPVEYDLLALENLKN